MFDDGHNTTTTRAQHGLERKLLPFHKRFSDSTPTEWTQLLALQRESHIAYLHKNLKRLPKHFLILDASRTWLVFWTLHSLSLLDAPLPDNPTTEAIIAFLGQCQHKDGGFGGGPGQIPHLAATYAAVMALVIIGTPESLSLIDRPKMEMCVPVEEGGGMSVHENGEVDIRSCYACIAVAHILNLDKRKIIDRCGMIDFVRRCQSFEGGLGGEPGNEAHGGYTFCGVATMVLISEMQVLNLASLLRWIVHMQGSMEGGFMGRTHKLVDGCYSFWQGSVFLIMKDYQVSSTGVWTPLHGLIRDEELEDLEEVVPQYNVQLGDGFSQRQEAKKQGEVRLRKCAEELELDLEQALTQLRQICNGEDPDEIQTGMDTFQDCFEGCQQVIQSTEFSFSSLFPPASSSRDRLPVHEATQVDHEVLYDALGLQFWILQHCQMDSGGLRDKPGTGSDPYHTCYCLSGLAASQQYSGLILGPKSNQLQEIDPVLNVSKVKRDFALQFFRG